MSHDWYVVSGYSYRLVTYGYVYQGTKWWKAPLILVVQLIISYAKIWKTATVTSVYTFRLEAGSAGTTNSSSYNTSQFKVYADTDCQNFVSQCIWYGFGGRSSSRKDYPMN